MKIQAFLKEKLPWIYALSLLSTLGAVFSFAYNLNLKPGFVLMLFSFSSFLFLLVLYLFLFAFFFMLQKYFRSGGKA